MNGNRNETFTYTGRFITSVHFLCTSTLISDYDARMAYNCGHLPLGLIKLRVHPSWNFSCMFARAMIMEAAQSSRAQIGKEQEMNA